MLQPIIILSFNSTSLHYYSSLESYIKIFYHKLLNATNVFLDFGYPNGHQQSYQQGIIKLANNFTCGRTAIMGDIFKFSGPYLYPFVIEYSLIAAAVLFAMWKNIGNGPR